jgi:hypothetical protein
MKPDTIWQWIGSMNSTLKQIASGAGGGYFPGVQRVCNV